MGSQRVEDDRKFLACTSCCKLSFLNRLFLFRHFFYVGFPVLLVLGQLWNSGCSDEDSNGLERLQPLDGEQQVASLTETPFQRLHSSESCEFPVDWPPVDPTDPKLATENPLLQGRMLVTSGLKAGNAKVSVRIQLSRDDSPSHRKRWNRDLKFPEYDWMSKLRVWDRQHLWLWPNLPYLLTADGLPRKQRYGGVDPGSGVDNDFAAVVVQAIEADGSGETLVTARWDAGHEELVDRRSVVHHAYSNDLIWTIPEMEKEGEFGVWLIYADFMQSRPPETWPEEQEYDGGILAFFRVGWRRTEDKKINIVLVENMIPPRSTGIDWPAWLEEHQRVVVP